MELTALMEAWVIRRGVGICFNLCVLSRMASIALYLLLLFLAIMLLILTTLYISVFKGVVFVQMLFWILDVVPWWSCLFGVMWDWRFLSASKFRIE